MKDDVLPADLLRKHDAVLVVACDARSVASVAFRREQIVGRDQADTRPRWRIARVRDCVDGILFDPCDARIFSAPLLIRFFTTNGGMIPYLIDALAV